MNIFEEIQTYLDLIKYNEMVSDTPEKLKSFLPENHKDADALIGPFVIYDLRNQQKNEQKQ